MWPSWQPAFCGFPTPQRRPRFPDRSVTPMEKSEPPTVVQNSVPWSVPVAVEDIPDHGLHIEIDAPAPVRDQVLALVAGLASVHDLPKLSAVFDLTRRGARVHVAGHVSARVAQSCVVTLEPMESNVEEAVDVTFAPVAAA